jgi:hypothetical protein
VKPAADRPTLSICQGHTDPRTTDWLRLPAAALLEDARRGALGAAGEATEVFTLPAAEAVAEPPASLDSHQFVACLERGLLGEVWRLRAPEGRERLAFCLPPSLAADAGAQLRHLLGLDHPALPHAEVAYGPAGQVVLLTDYPTRTLAGWSRECRDRGLPGIPARELLPCLESAAEALDQLFRRYGLHHLDLQPARVWPEGGRVRLGGFGLMQLLGLPSAGAAAVNPHYAAPELLRGRASTRSDQYSLALLYAEAASGEHPRHGFREGRAGARPLKLGLLSEGEREVLTRALHTEPSRRFASCADFVAALRAALPRGGSLVLRGPAEPPALVPARAPLSRGPTSLDGFVRELLTLAAGPAAMRESPQIRYRLEPGQSLKHRCAVNLFPGGALLKLEGFRQEWGGALVRRDSESFVLAVRTSVSFWERLVGRQVGLEIHVRMAPARPDQRLAEVGVLIRPFGCGRARAVKLLEQTGPVLLESLRAHLQALPEQRAQERLLWHERLRVHPVVAGLRAADGIDCLAKDISARGIGFFLPQPLAATHLYVNHPGSPQLADIAALVKVVRGQRCPDGWYEVGALFTPE